MDGVLSRSGLFHFPSPGSAESATVTDLERSAVIVATMPYSKEKAGILTVASSMIVFAMQAISNGEYIAGALFLVVSAGLFGAYEIYQVKEIPFSEEDIVDTVEETADNIEENTN